MAVFGFSPTRSGNGFLGCPLIGIPFTSNPITVATDAPPVTLALTGGSLPNGLSIVQTGPNTFVLQGTPTTAGNFVFEITATDSGAATGTGAFAVAVTNFEECTLVDQINAAFSQGANFIEPLLLDIATTRLNGGVPFQTDLFDFIGNIAGLQAAINAGLGTNANNQIIVDPFASFITANSFNLQFDFFFRSQNCMETELVEDNIIINGSNQTPPFFIAIGTVLQFQTEGCCDCREAPPTPPKKKRGIILPSIPCICIEPSYFENSICPDTIRYSPNNNSMGNIYYKTGLNEKGWCCYSIAKQNYVVRFRNQSCMEIDRFGKIMYSQL